MMQTYFNPIQGSQISFFKKGGAVLKKNNVHRCSCGCAAKLERRGGKVIETCPCKNK